MRCPFCGVQDTHVKDSRVNEEGNTVRRRRYCIICHGRFTTFEKIQLREILVLKKNGEKELYDQDKASHSIRLATRKRNISSDQIEMIVNRITNNLIKLGENIITTDQIGQLVMEELSKLDQIAYVRYASVYREFCEVKDFEKFISNIKNIEPN